jgi:hypothetical protein
MFFKFVEDFILFQNLQLYLLSGLVVCRRVVHVEAHGLDRLAAHLQLINETDPGIAITVRINHS